MISDRRQQIAEAAVALVHQLYKELDWIRVLARRLPERLDEPERAQRDAANIRALTETAAERARGFLDEVTEGGPRRLRSLRSVVAGAIRSVSRRFVGSRISQGVPPRLGRLLVDTLLEGVLADLLDNALRATLRPGGTAHGNGAPVHVQASWEEGCLVISVEDEGCGMSEATLSRCFDLGFSGRGPDAGHGLGLAASRATMAAIGGALELESVEEEGTRAVLRLPVPPALLGLDG